MKNNFIKTKHLSTEESYAVGRIRRKKNAFAVIRAIGNGFHTTTIIKKELGTNQNQVYNILKELENESVVKIISDELKKKNHYYVFTEFGHRLYALIDGDIQDSKSIVENNVESNQIEEKKEEVIEVPKTKNNVAMYVNGKYKELIEVLEKETPHNRFTIADIGFKKELLVIAKYCNDNPKVNAWFEKYGSKPMEVM